MPNAGDFVRAADTTSVVRLQESADSAAVSTVETIVSSLTFNAVAGAVYELHFNLKLVQSVANDSFIFSIKEDNATGTTVDAWLFKLPAASSGMVSYYQVDWTASATGSKTIVGTIIRSGGTGTATRSAKSNYQIYRVS